MYPLELTPEKDNDEPLSDTNRVKLKKSKSLSDLDSAKGDSGGSDGGGRTKIWKAAAIDEDMKRELLQQEKEDNEFDDFRSKFKKGPYKLTNWRSIKGEECCEITNMN